jgi:hypothetical protein
MRNKIPCSAERLGLLTSQMIQAVSDASAFQIAHQYLASNRVRIVEADDSQITSAVVGNSGLYEQNIRLKDGHLISKCSCTRPEEPMCRHCIAVLLEYQRWAQPRQSRPSHAKGSITAPLVGPSGNGKGTALQSFSSDVKLSEVMILLEWLQPATKALERQEPLPALPALGPGAISTWMHTIKNTEDRRRENDAVMTSLESQLKDRETDVRHLTQQLQSSLRECHAAKASAQNLQREVASYQRALTRAGELTAEVVRHAGQMRAVSDDVLQKGSQLDTLLSSLKKVAEALQSAVALRPPS